MTTVTVATATYTLRAGWRYALELAEGCTIANPITGTVHALKRPTEGHVTGPLDSPADLHPMAAEWGTDALTRYDVDAGGLGDLCAEAREEEAHGSLAVAAAMWARAAEEYQRAGLAEASATARAEAVRLGVTS